MKPSVLKWIVCPICGSDFQLDKNSSNGRPDEVENGLLVCGHQHRFPIDSGVPRLRLDSLVASGGFVDSRRKRSHAVADTFDREWRHFDHDKARTWGDTLGYRTDLFLREVDMSSEQLDGKLVLDAGCGNGSLSWGISQMGCEVLAADVSDSVLVAHRFYAVRPPLRTHFIQADLLHPPFRPDTFDVVYSSGVLHHNPDTREALGAIIPALAPGGTIYIWVYHDVPGLKVKLQYLLRRIVSRWPAGLKHAFALHASN